MLIYKIHRGYKGSTLISCGKWIPRDWKIVAIKVVEKKDNLILVAVERVI